MASSSKQKAHERYIRRQLRLVDKRVAELEKAILPEIRSAISEIKDTLLRENLTDWQRHNAQALMAALEQTRERLEGNLTAAILGVGQNSGGPLAELARTAAMNTLQHLSTITGTALRANPPMRVLALMQDDLAQLIVDVGNDVVRDVSRLIRRLQLGASAGPDTDFRQQISQAVGDLKRNGRIIAKAQNRVSTILRTEVNKAYNVSQSHVLKQLSEDDPNVGLKWIHRPSNYPRSNHAALNGKVIYPGRGEKFSVAGIGVLGPHDPALPAGEVINCHCGVVAEYDLEGAAAKKTKSTASTQKTPKYKRAKPTSTIVEKLGSRQYRQITDEREMVEMLTRMAVKLSPQEAKAVREYGDFLYKTINGVLRGAYNGPDVAEAKKYIRLIERAMKRSALEEDVVLFRRTADRAEDIASILGVDDPRALRGGVIEMQGFTSTSVSQDVAERFSDGHLVFEIRAPRGTRGLVVEDPARLASDTFYHEYEWLLPHRTKIFVVDVQEDSRLTEKAGHPVFRIIAEIVEGG